MAEASSRRRVSCAQLDSLWEFLNDHRDIGTGYNKTSRARDYSKRMWQTIAVTLNAHGDGAVKDWKGWSKYWNDYKSKLKKTVAAIRSSLQRTGGGPSDAPSLSDIEQKFLQLLGGSFGSGLPGIRVEPFNQETEEREIVNLIVNTEETQLNLFGDSISILGLAQNELPQPGLSITPPPILRTPTPSPQPIPRRSPRTRDPQPYMSPRRIPRTRDPQQDLSPRPIPRRSPRTRDPQPYMSPRRIPRTRDPQQDLSPRPIPRTRDPQQDLSPRPIPRRSPRTRDPQPYMSPRRIPRTRDPQQDLSPRPIPRRSPRTRDPQPYMSPRRIPRTRDPQQDLSPRPIPRRSPRTRDPQPYMSPRRIPRTRDPQQDLSPRPIPRTRDPQQDLSPRPIPRRSPRTRDPQQDMTPRLTPRTRGSQQQPVSTGLRGSPSRRRTGRIRRREPPMSQEEARRRLVAIAGENMERDRERNELLRELTNSTIALTREVGKINEILQTRLPLPETPHLNLS